MRATAHFVSSFGIRHSDFVIRASSTMLRKIDRILLRVPALASAVGYYRYVLGLKLTRQEGRVASFRLGDDATELVIHAEEDLPAEAVYFLVDDVRELYHRRAE